MQLLEELIPITTINIKMFWRAILLYKKKCYMRREIYIGSRTRQQMIFYSKLIRHKNCNMVWEN
ncbi:hypothetical protein CW304_19725 [Bacillus sp. UFRGS-B20]|nr:hypothetical protein CW304_19725 [Bacillus sp. UFRGS-B20]